MGYELRLGTHMPHPHQSNILIGGLLHEVALSAREQEMKNCHLYSSRTSRRGKRLPEPVLHASLYDKRNFAVETHCAAS